MSSSDYEETYGGIPPQHRAAHDRYLREAIRVPAGDGGDPYLVGAVGRSLMKISRKNKTGRSAFLIIHKNVAASIADALIDVSEGLEE